MFSAVFYKIKGKRKARDDNGFEKTHRSREKVIESDYYENNEKNKKQNHSSQGGCPDH